MDCTPKAYGNIDPVMEMMLDEWAQDTSACCFTYIINHVKWLGALSCPP